MLPSREAPNNCYLLHCCLESVLPIYRWLGASLKFDPDLRRLPRRLASLHNKTKEEEVLIIDQCSSANTCQMQYRFVKL